MTLRDTDLRSSQGINNAFLQQQALLQTNILFPYLCSLIAGNLRTFKQAVLREMLKIEDNWTCSAKQPYGITLLHIHMYKRMQRRTIMSNTICPQ